MMLSGCVSLGDLDMFLNHDKWYTGDVSPVTGKAIVTEWREVHVRVRWDGHAHFEWEDKWSLLHEEDISDTMEEAMYRTVHETGTPEEQAEWRGKLAEAWCVKESEVDWILHFE